jgi:hypothetical protein
MGQPAAALAIGTSSKTDASWNFNWICWYCKNWCGRNAKLLLEKCFQILSRNYGFYL